MEEHNNTFTPFLENFLGGKQKEREEGEREREIYSVGHIEVNSSKERGNIAWSCQLLRIY